MAALEAFLEAHSYSGGLRHTAFPPGGARPAWAPAADSVGWRDEFEFGADDAVVEFHQRAGPQGPASWLAVYRRSHDVQFGDRRNHAGMGVWLHGERIADPRSLVSALEQFTRALAKDPRPEALADKVAEFASEPFLPRYLLSAERLPRDWHGAPASATTLVDTSYRFIAAPAFDRALGALAEEIARCSLDWAGKGITPRTLILVSPRAAAPVDRAFTDAREPGSFLADLLERLPLAFDDERRALTEAEGTLATSRTRWEAERDQQQKAWDAERLGLQLLDRLPATPEGIAIRLNAISAQLKEIGAASKPPALQALPPIPRAPAAHRPSRQYEPIEAPVDASWDWFAYGALVVILFDGLAYLVIRLLDR